MVETWRDGHRRRTQKEPGKRGAEAWRLGGDAAFSRVGRDGPALQAAFPAWTGGTGGTGETGGTGAGTGETGVIDEVRVSDAALAPGQFLRMQPVGMDEDEILRVSFDPDEYGALNVDMNLADALGPNRDWGVRRVSVPDDAKDIVAMRFGVTPRGRRLTYWIRNVRILRPRQ